MKICRMMFHSDYVSDEQLIAAIQNSFYLDKCYLGFSTRTWTGREMESININLLQNIKDISPNVEVIWMDKSLEFCPDPMKMDSSSRNLILDKAIEEKFDFLIVQDTDEFVHEDDWEFLLKDYFPTMVSFGYDTCAIRLKNFWKSWKNILVCDEIIVPEWPGEWATFGLNLSRPVRFSNSRHTESIVKCGIKQDVFLYHGSWVLNDEQVRRKITSWGHSKDINYDEWYNEKWLNWTDKTTDLHPSTRPHIWKNAIPYEGKLPRECENWFNTRNKQ